MTQMGWFNWDLAQRDFYKLFPEWVCVPRHFPAWCQVCWLSLGRVSPTLMTFGRGGGGEVILPEQSETERRELGARGRGMELNAGRS